MSGSRSSPRSAPGGAGTSGCRGSCRDRASPELHRGRGQAEPLAALAALLAVGIGIALFAGAAGEAPAGTDRSLAEPALERAATAVGDGVVAPTDLPEPGAVAPDGYAARITLLAGNETYRVGPDPATGTDRASRPVTVRVGPADQRPGRLVVEVWAP